MFKCKHKKIDLEGTIFTTHIWGFCKRCNKAVVKNMQGGKYVTMPMFDKVKSGR